MGTQDIVKANRYKKEIRILTFRILNAFCVENKTIHFYILNFKKGILGFNIM